METEARDTIKTKTGHANPWLMVAIASLANFALYIIIFGVPPVIPSLVQLGLTHEQAGLLMTVTLATYCVCSLLGGALADAFGARPVLTLGLLLASVSGYLFTVTDNFLLMVALRALVGVGSACVFAPGLRFLLAALPKGISGVGIGWYMIAINVGVATPMFLTPLVMDQFGWHGPLAVFAAF
ncbi:MAG: MFS transporter, partial [Dehalococcoidia bacterium]|nr:MFS transporter [Dehalococcoidia bacterium]